MLRAHVKASRYIFALSINPLPDDKILDWSKLKQIADISKCILNVPYTVENIVRKGETACYKMRENAELWGNGLNPT